MSKIILWIIILLTWWIIAYVNAHKSFPKLSSYIDTKTIHWIEPSWVIADSTYCVWKCENYSSSSSRWGSSYGWGK